MRLMCVAALGLLAGCAGNPSAARTPTVSGLAAPVGTVAPAGLRGTPVTTTVCPRTPADSSLLPAYDAPRQPIKAVESITVCGFGPDQNVTVHSGDPRFGRALALLSRPDRKAPEQTLAPGQVISCPANGQARLVVFATGGTGSFLVWVPVITGRCGSQYLLPLPLPLPLPD